MRPIGDVEGGDVGLALEAGRRFLERCESPPEEAEPRALRIEPPGDGPADSRTGSGDDKMSLSEWHGGLVGFRGKGPLKG